MPNKLLTDTAVTVEAIRVLQNNSALLKRINKQYDNRFGTAGAQIGSLINVKVPWRPAVARQTALAVQAFTENTVPLQLQYPYQAALNFTIAELSLSVQDFSKQVLGPVMPAMAAAIDGDALGLALSSFLQVGTPGITPGTAGGNFAANILLNYNMPDYPLNANALLDGQAAPRDKNRHMLLDQWAMAGTVRGMSGFVNDQATVGAQYKDGMMNYALDMMFSMDQNIATLTTGAHGGNPLVFGSNQTGSTLIVNGATANVTNWLNAGEIINVAGVHHVNPVNQKAQSQYLATFVVTANCSSDVNGQVLIPIYPAITPVVAGSSYGTVDVSPLTGAAVTLLSGSANTTYPINILFHQDAFTMATADLLKPNGVDFAGREEIDGVSMCIVRAYDINSMQMPARADILAGYASLRPELSVRVAG